MADVKFNKIALIGIGLIGSSLARVIRQKKLADHIAIATRTGTTLERARELDLGFYQSLVYSDASPQHK